MNWAAIALALVQLATAILEWRRKANALSQVHDQLAAQAALKMLEATEYGQQLRTGLNTMSDQEAQDTWNQVLRSQP